MPLQFYLESYHCTQGHVDFLLCYLFFLHMHVQLYQHHLLKGLCSIVLYLLLCQKSVDCIYVGLFLSFSSIIYLFISLPLSHSLDYYSFIVSLELGSVSPLTWSSLSILSWLFWIFCLFT